MGYFLDFYFDDKEVDNSAIIVNKLCKAGAQVIPADKTDPSDDRAICLRHYALPPITVFRDNEKRNRAARAHIRISWSTNRDELVKILGIIINMANDIGCKVYDGQLHEYVTHENMYKIIDFFSMGRKQVKDLFGITDIKKADQRISDKKYLSITREINPNDPILYKKLEELDLSIRPLNCLKKAHIDYVGELVQKTYEELRAMPNMGRRSVDQIREVLAEMGLRLGTKLDKWLKEDAEKLLARIVSPYN